MKKSVSKSFYLTLFLIALLFGCNHEEVTMQELISANAFNLQPNILQAGDSLKLIYASSFNDKNDTFKYLIQVVAISLKTDDTVNILCSHTDQLKVTDGNTIFQYEPMDEFLQSCVLGENAILKDMIKDDSLALAVWNNTKNTMVAQDPKFKEFSNTNYPTVFGELK